jgi:hypothetical protein
MEPLWSPVVAIGGNHRQIAGAEEPPKQAKTVALGCDRLLETFMVRRGSTVRVRQRASANYPQIRLFHLLNSKHSGERGYGAGTRGLAGYAKSDAFPRSKARGASFVLACWATQAERRSRLEHLGPTHAGGRACPGSYATNTSSPLARSRR